MATIGIDAMKAMATGTELGVSDWVTIDQAMIDRFADATDDHQFIHVNPDMARMTPFGGTIAHGFLTLSLLTTLLQHSEAPSVEGVRMAVNYGTNKVRFLTPVRSGSRVRGRFVHGGFEERRPGQYQQTIEATVEIEGQDKPALVAEWLFQLFA